MAITTISLLNTFLEQMLKVNELASWVNGAETGSSSVANTAITGAVFKTGSNNSGLSLSESSVQVGNTVYIDVGTLGTSVGNTATHIIASMNVVNSVHQFTRSIAANANVGFTAATAAQVQAAIGRDDANTASLEAGGAHGTANTGLTTAQGAFAKANASSNVADDTTPQLSSNLDSQGKSFENVSTITIHSGERVEWEGTDNVVNGAIQTGASGLVFYIRRAGNTGLTDVVRVNQQGHFHPLYDNQSSLGVNDRGWTELYVTDGGTIYYGDHEITQSGNVITFDTDVSMNAWVGGSGRFDDVATVSEIWSHANNKVLTTDGAWDAVGYAAVAGASGITLNMAANNNFNVVINQTTTLNNPSNLKPGQSGVLVLSFTGAHSVSYGTNWVFESDTAPSASGNTAARDLLSYIVTPNKKIFGTLFTNVPIT